MKTKEPPRRAKLTTAVVHRRRRKASPRQSAASKGAPARKNDVAAVREVAEMLLSNSPRHAGTISDMVITLADKTARAERDMTRLRAWQHLLSDLALALGQVGSDEEARVRSAADALRRSIRMIDRNPEGSLAVRPASRRIMEALFDLGGSASFAETRAKSRHSENHFSNSLGALRAHGFVEVRRDAADKRRKALALTSRGKAALGAAKTDGALAKTDRSSSVYVPDRVIARADAPSYPAPKLEKLHSAVEPTT